MSNGTEKCKRAILTGIKKAFLIPDINRLFYELIVNKCKKLKIELHGFFYKISKARAKSRSLHQDLMMCNTDYIDLYTYPLICVVSISVHAFLRGQGRDQI